MKPTRATPGMDADLLLSLPPAAADHFGEIQPFRAGAMLVRSDPVGHQLGSGGGTAHLLTEAWQAARVGASDTLTFAEWLERSPKMVVHGSGESRRLPAYAPHGKPLLPIPSIRGLTGQRPDQLLLDLQLRVYQRFLWHAPAATRVMIACGDVLLRCDRWLPRYPDADVVILGLTAPPEEAERHGVMVCPADAPRELAFFLQKPPAERLRQLAAHYAYYLDTGVWLLSGRAVGVLMKKCGWQPKAQAFARERPRNYDLYAKFGPALGAEPVEHDREIAALTAAVLPLPDGRFYHFGTSRSLLASIEQLQKPADDQRSFDQASLEPAGAPVIHHATVQCPLSAENRHIWIENAVIPASWRLSRRHVLTGIPANAWTLKLEPGTCLDAVPVPGGRLCLRPYGFDDSFRGEIDDPATTWMGRPVGAWLAARGIDVDEAGLSGSPDLQEAPLFPAIPPGDILTDFAQWLCASAPEAKPDCRSAWLQQPRFSARDLLRSAQLRPLADQRLAQMARSAAELTRAAWLEACREQDLAAAAEMQAACRWPAPPAEETGESADALAVVHDRMFRAASARRRRPGKAKAWEATAFEKLRHLLVGRMELAPVEPVRNVMDDQIVWGRSPVRLDLAGGWTDTPPYCLEQGGRVVNVAVDLNGQPPIQVFGRPCARPEIVVRSIDLGTEDRVTAYGDLARCGELGSGFSIARAALALAGLDPRFHVHGGRGTLREQLRRDFGGGIELSMLAAVPKGSGLGTSSILAATLLGTLSELLGLKWDRQDLFMRTLALEQMLTAGGGWQDQAGGLFGGLKLIETTAGLEQRPVVRWLPGTFFADEYANRQVLLYYTGLTRIAHGILGDIVRGFFLNASAHLNIAAEIGRNALLASDSVQRNDWDGLCEAVRRSWSLNQRIDRGTNPPPVQDLLDLNRDDIAAAKLLGAGGGGYMLILARDRDAAKRIRRRLADRPPNSRARLVDLALSQTGFQVTRS